jgi:hypothetical protein
MANETVFTPEFRLSYPWLWEPRKKDINGKELSPEDWTYECQGIFLKPEDMSEEDKAAWGEVVRIALQAKYDMWEESMPGHPQYDPNYPEGFQTFRKDGDAENRKNEKKKKPIDPNIVNKVLVTMKSKKFPVGICKINPGNAPTKILDPAEIYAGCYCIAEVTCYAFEKPFNGIRLGLRNIMKVRDGQPLGRSADPVARFTEQSKAAKPAHLKVADNSSEMVTTGV